MLVLLLVGAIGVVFVRHFFIDAPEPNLDDFLVHFPLAADRSDSVAEGIADWFEGVGPDARRTSWIISYARDELAEKHPGKTVFTPSTPVRLDRSVWSEEVVGEVRREFDVAYPDFDARLEELRRVLDRPSWSAVASAASESAAHIGHRAHKPLFGRVDLALLERDWETYFVVLELVESLSIRLLESANSTMDQYLGLVLLRHVQERQVGALFEVDLPEEFERRSLRSRWRGDNTREWRIRFAQQYLTTWVRDRAGKELIESSSLAPGPPGVATLNSIPLSIRSSSYRENRTHARLAHRTREWIRRLEEAEAPAELEIEIPPPRPRMAWLWTGNSGCHLETLYGALLEEWESTISGSVAPDVFRLIIAARRAERLTGRLPDTVEGILEVVPELGEPPVDSRCGLPIGYDPVRRIVWAPGRDGVDDGGDGWEDQRDDPEMTRGQFRDEVWVIPERPAP